MQIDKEKLEILTQCKTHGRHHGFQKMVLRNIYDITSQCNISYITENID